MAEFYSENLPGDTAPPPLLEVALQKLFSPIFSALL